MFERFYPTMHKKIFYDLIKIMDSERKGFIRLIDILDFVFKYSRTEKVQ